MTQEPHEHYWVLDHSVIDLEDENRVLYRCSICPATMTYKEAKEKERRAEQKRLEQLKSAP